MTSALSTKLLTTDTCAILLIDYQPHVLQGVTSTDHGLIETNARALARAGKLFGVPTLLTTIGVKLRGDKPTLPSLRSDLADEPEFDRNTMNAWEDAVFLDAIKRTGRRRLIMAGLWTEVCLMLPVLHAQREGYETYFVVDAVGGSTPLAHDTAIQRMLQAGSQPITTASMVTEWIRDWGTTPYQEASKQFFEWYRPEIEKVGKRLRGQSDRKNVA